MKSYFSHDEGARNDPRLVQVMMDLGHEGKSVYWDLVEMLYEQNGYLLLAQCKSYAFALRTSTELILKLVNDFGLFEKDNEKFWSPSALRRLGQRNEKSERRAAAGAKGGKARAEREAIAKATAEQPPSNTQAMLGNSQALLNDFQAIKGKEIKGNKRTDGSSQPASQPAFASQVYKSAAASELVKFFPDESEVFSIAGFAEFVSKMGFADIDRGVYLPEIQRKADLMQQQRDEAGWGNYVLDYLKREKANGRLLTRELAAERVREIAPIPDDPRDLWGFSDKTPPS